jgi:Ala-tRNA(Pro) deacylase
MDVMLRNRATDVLDEAEIGYEVIHHRADYSAMETAEDTHTPGRQFAKVVVLTTPEGYVMAVLPATKRVDLPLFARIAGTAEVGLAGEDALASLFPDCQTGAEPPFGRPYCVPVYVEESLAEQETITFNAGTHDEAIRMRYADYERLERPRRARFAASS